MKRIVFAIFVLITLGVVCQAQTYDSVVYQNGKWNNMDVRNMMELRDGGIVANVQLFNYTASGGYESDYGCRLYKAVRDENGITVTDSLTIEDADMNYFLLTRNPFGDDNILAKVERNFDSCRCELVIRFFNDDMSLEPEKEVRTVLVDTLMPELADTYMLTPEGDIVAFFPIRSRDEYHIVVAGIDGTVKQHSTMPISATPVKTFPKMGVFSMSPRQYYLYGNATYHCSGMGIMVLDSLFTPIRNMTPNGLPYGYNFDYNDLYDRLLPWDDTSFFFCSAYSYMYIDPETGIYVPGSDEQGLALGILNNEDARVYKIRTIQGQSVYPLFGISKSADGCIYFGAEAGGIRMTKLDKDLNIKWERSHCISYIDPIARCMMVLDNGDIACVGDAYTFYTTPQYTVVSASYIYSVVFYDLSLSLPENKTDERPYTFYPNPANDELNLNISPEVKPSMIELYDKQGRMVRSQEANFERMSLHGLPAGTYALRVSLKNGKSYTSTVVKK